MGIKMIGVNDFLKGCIFTSSFFLCYKAYSDFYHYRQFLDVKLEEFDHRLDNLEDFRLRFYQIYTARDRRVWDYSSDEEDFIDDEEDEEV